MDAVIRYRGKKYRLNLDYRVVLDCFEALQDDALPDINRVEVCLEQLVRGHVKRLSANQKVELFNLIYDQHIRLNKRSGESGPKSVDFRFDFDLIYASFMQAYHIDILKDRLTWYEFYNLFQGLPADTKIREVMSIRQRETPTPNKYNQKEIAELQRLKSYWALPVECLGNNYQDGLKKLFSTLKSMAKRG